MLRRLSTPITLALLSGGLLLAQLRADESNNTTGTVAGAPNGQSVDLHPFTHLAYVPAGADLSTIRFNKVKLVKVQTKVKYTADSNYCKEADSRDPGGSSACPQMQTEAAVPAFEVTYSYTGLPLASDEYSNRSATFSVYFRPGELDPDVQRALAGKKLSRADAAAYFAVSTKREAARRVAIDEKQSRFCAGNFVDGGWTHTDPKCNDTIAYTTVAEPSDYITVKVEPTPAQVQQAGMRSAK